MGDTISLPPHVKISGELVHQVWTEAVTTKISVLEAEEAETMLGPYRDLHQRLHDKRERKHGTEAADKLSLGYLAAHRILRGAFGEPLPPRSPRGIDSYMVRITGRSGLSGRILDEDFIADYIDHPAVLHLVNNLLDYPGSKSGARIMFELLGPYVNPERWEALGIPRQSTAP